MKVVQVLNISDKEYFEAITTSLKMDIENATGKEIDTIKEGFKYKKTSSQRKGEGSEITVRIKSYVPYKLYVATFTTSLDHTQSSHMIKRIDDQHVEITYEEKYEALTPKKMSKFKAGRIEKGMEKKAIRVLKAVERYAKEQRNKEEDQDETTSSK